MDFFAADFVAALFLGEDELSSSLGLADPFAGAALVGRPASRAADSTTPVAVPTAARATAGAALGRDVGSAT